MIKVDDMKYKILTALLLTVGFGTSALAATPTPTLKSYIVNGKTKKCFSGYFTGPDSDVKNKKVNDIIKQVTDKGDSSQAALLGVVRGHVSHYGNKHGNECSPGDIDWLIKN